MICVAVTYVIQPGHEDEAVELFHHMTEQTRTEPGNLFYQVHRSSTKPRQFFIYEQYTDQAALDAHRAAPYFTQYLTNRLFTFLESRVPEIYEPLL